ncbi:MAG TPA: transposase, partial [Bradyrhizobium sp.]|nr:transposase [Bradyrhizobium sp.]
IRQGRLAGSDMLSCTSCVTLATPERIKDWSLTSLKEKLIKIGAKVVSHGRYVAFQLAEVAIPQQMFQEILRLITELRPQPPPVPA